MKTRPFEPLMPEPLAFFITWTTYGTWLPGDERGWVERGKGLQIGDQLRRELGQMKMTESACTLDIEQRSLVEQTIVDHCRIRSWELHAKNCRTNHVHVVVSAHRDPEVVRNQLKAWTTRRLKELERKRKGLPANDESVRQNWWTERGSCRYIGDEWSLEAAVRYVDDLQ